MTNNSRSLFILVLIITVVGMFLYMNNRKNEVARAVLKVCRRAAEMHAIYPDSDYIGDKMNDAELFGEPPFTLNTEEKHFNGRCVSTARVMNLIE